MAEDPRPTRSVRVLVVACVVFLADLWGLHRLAVQQVPAQLKDASWPTPVLVAGAALVGIVIVRSASAWAIGQAATYLGVGRARQIQTLLNVALYFILALVIASQTQIDLSGIAVSGAVTGVVFGIAAQASLSNIVAGIVILFTRPFRPGQFVTVRAAAFAGSEYSGEVGEITLFYTLLHAGPQEIRVPNSSMVTSVVTLRPQVLDVYLPVILPPARWERFSTSSLARQISSALPSGRQVTVVVERVEGTSVQIGVHASVANEEERSTLEGALLRALAPAGGSDSSGLHSEES